VYHTKIPFRDFKAEVGREDVSKPTNRSMCLHDNSNDIGVRTIHFSTPTHLSRVKHSCNETGTDIAGLI
jgi:hypothetical protein